MSYLRGNYMEKTVRAELESKGFEIDQDVRTISGSTIDLIGKCGNNYIFFEFKNAPVSTFDVAKFSASIADVNFPGEKRGFIFTDSIETGSAKSLSDKLNIPIIKTNEKELKEKISQLLDRCGAAAWK